MSTRLRSVVKPRSSGGEQVRVLAHQASFGVVEGGEDFVEPLDLALFDADAAAQDQVLVQVLARAAPAGRGEVALLDLAVDVEALGVRRAVPDDLGGDGAGSPKERTADLHGEFLGPGRRVRLGEPADELGVARRR